MSKELSAEQVRKQCDPAAFDCNTTEDLKPIGTIIGQGRALSALKFGLNINKPGFNIFVSGPMGTGRTTAIKSFLDTLAAKKETPSDWCYMYNFRDSYCPTALKMPAGTGQGLQKDMKHILVMKKSFGVSVDRLYSMIFILVASTPHFSKIYRA